MKTIIAISLLSLTLFAKNPSVYSQLGDIIYDNSTAIEKLSEIAELSNYKKEIQEYIKDVNITKKDGFAIESGDRSVDDTHYLKKLRELYKKDRNFLRISKISFEESMQKSNVRLFEQLINSEIIELDEYERRIVEFYTTHKDEISLPPEVKLFVEEALKKRKSEIEAREAANKRDSEAERIRWLREKDKEREERKIKQLEEELLKKKREIREYQKEELLGS
ncbi:hypothetical protein FCU45_01915 [Sulfurimonas crateris]|uniref:Uncharacterized protein n=1 Tax=Sulfurimonas crateris TaxID=2574727 RepID=A0A4U2ZC52_9BACT|nr:hypothetical protein [Sulfurimonas crateris]TKI71160.1 hypothetical protein FCU45_01915 [Sulfurimonas crateris]